MKRTFYSVSLLLFFFFSLAGCGTGLTDVKVEELVRLHYRQQSLVQESGKWQPDSIVVIVREQLAHPDQSYRVKVFVTGFYVYPVLEGSPSSLSDRFADSLEFQAIPSGKRWLAKHFQVTYSRLE